MKILNKVCIAALALLTMQACSDDFYDVNTSQNDPTTSLPSLTLPVAQTAGANYISGSRFGDDDFYSVNTLGNFWGQAWSVSGNFIFFDQFTNYRVNSSFIPAYFENAYVDVLANYDYVEQYGTGTEDSLQYANYHAIAKIMKAYHFQYLVDAYGSVPYTEAFGGGANPTPAYDEGGFIYNAIYDELLLAQEMITDAMSNSEVLEVGAEDIMLQGDMAMWAKFANSLKLRILLRQSETGADLSTQYAELAANTYGFLGAGETVYANPGYAQEVNKQNPLWNGFGQSATGDLAPNAEAAAASVYAIEKLEDYNDPRLAYLYTPVGVTIGEPDPTGTYLGIAQNENQNNASAPQATDLSHIGPGVLKGPTQNAIIFSSYESLFLQAEAVQRGFLPGDAQALYESAIAESFLQLSIGNEDATFLDDPTTYYGQAIPNVGWAASTNKIEAIITQKWIALSGTNGFELWAEFRRTGYPSDLPVAPDATDGNNVPLRLSYPTSELGTNPGNVPTGLDPFSTPVFWDVN